MNKNNEKKINEAVALRYDSDRDRAPVVVAKGKGPIAERIIAAAREHDIHIEKDRDIIKVLSRLEIGDEIPPELYRVVAEILSFIYSLEEK